MLDSASEDTPFFIQNCKLQSENLMRPLYTQNEITATQLDYCVNLYEFQIFFFLVLLWYNP